MLAMWVPELPFQLAAAREAGLSERPLAFLNPETPRSPSLWFVNRRAKAEGAASGDPLDLALRSVPGLRVLDPSPQTWWQAHACLGDFLQRWSPQGQLGRLGEALVELRGTEGLFGPPQDAAARILRELRREHGWRGHGGLSSSATAATLAARLEHSVERVLDGGERAFLGPQPLRRLPDLAPRVHARFQRLGLRRFQDLQPVPVGVVAQLVPERLAPKLLAQVRGEDRLRLPLLAEKPGSSRHPWRLEPPRLPEEIGLAAWCLQRLWKEPRSPRKAVLRWWDVDGEPHHWRASDEDLCEPPLLLAQRVEAAFRERSVRRALVREVELRLAWGLGQAAPLFQEERSRKLGRLEVSLARLRTRYPTQPVETGWMKAAEEHEAAYA